MKIKIRSSRLDYRPNDLSVDFNDPRSSRESCGSIYRPIRAKRSEMPVSDRVSAKGQKNLSRGNSSVNNSDSSLTRDVTSTGYIQCLCLSSSSSRPIDFRVFLPKTQANALCVQYFCDDSSPREAFHLIAGIIRNAPRDSADSCNPDAS